MTEAEELTRLRARVAELEAERAATTDHPPHRNRGRAAGALASVILITLACILAPLSVTSVWASSVLSDTDRYVETVAPVADDPGVQAAIVDEVTAAIMERLDTSGLITEALDGLAQIENLPPRVADALPALATPIAQGIEGFVRDQTAALVASDEFAKVWAEANRVAHDQVVSLLGGETSGLVTAQGDTITLNLKPVIAEVKTRLVDQGFNLAANIPEVDRSFTLVESEGISKSQRAFDVLETLGAWLPFIALALFIAGVFLASDRRRALLRGAVGVIIAMVALGAALTAVRVLYVETTPAGILTAESAGNVFDSLVRFLRTGLRAVATLGILVAAAAFLTGRSAAAVRTRSAFTSGIGSARSGAESAGWNTGRLGGWVYGHKTALRITSFVAGGLALMFWSQPTAWVVLTVALLVLVALVIIEFLGRPPTATSGPPPESVLPPPRGSGSTDETPAGRGPEAGERSDKVTLPG